MSTRVSTLDCERNQIGRGVCQFIERKFFNKKIKYFDICDFEAVEVRSDVAGKYRLIFRVSGEGVPFTSYDSFREGDIKESAERVKYFLEDSSADTVKIVQQEKANIFSGIFFFAGGLFWFNYSRKNKDSWIPED